MSKVLIVNEYHLQKTPDGKYWSNGVIDYNILRRYLDVFDEVLVAIRISDMHRKDEGYDNLCSGDGVHFLAMPDFVGIKGYFKNFFLYRKKIQSYSKLADCAVVRVPNALSFQYLRAINRSMPYALEVAVDPWTWLAPKNYDSVFRPILRVVWTFLLKYYCSKANGVAYVTEKYLQKRYPCRAMRQKRGFMASYSTVSIDSSIEYKPKKYQDTGVYHIIHVSNAFTTYSKGHLECIEIIKKLRDRGMDVYLTFVGDGKLRGEFEDYSKKMKLSSRIKFVGRVNSKENMFRILREADLLLFPTHSEGLPRTVIESMSVGTPVIATNVGGIPELIDHKYIFNVGDTEGMAKACYSLLRDVKTMSRLSEYYIRKSSLYYEEKLQIRRKRFYELLDRVVLKESQLRM